MSSGWGWSTPVPPLLHSYCSSVHALVTAMSSPQTVCRGNGPSSRRCGCRGTLRLQWSRTPGDAQARHACLVVIGTGPQRGALDMPDFPPGQAIRQRLDVQGLSKRPGAATALPSGVGKFRSSRAATIFGDQLRERAHMCHEKMRFVAVLGLELGQGRHHARAAGAVHVRNAPMVTGAVASPVARAPGRR
jgi:hypothetical protein